MAAVRAKPRTALTKNFFATIIKYPILKTPVQ
jgi:hypothetical protein